MAFEQNYNPKECEARIRQFWDANKVYSFNEKSRKKIYAIDTPPPTISGRMHVGHAFSFSQQDFIARFKRMNGFEVFYPFGTDDNGLPTEKLVEKKFNVKGSKMERSKFIELCDQFLKEERPLFIQDWKNIGMSCDFNLCYSTIDANSRAIAQKSFLALAKKNSVYRKEAPVLWDTQFQTAIAQAELEDVEKETFFNDIVFKTESGQELIIATTRPEMLSACVAIFANPEDVRYQKLFGTFAYSPIYNKKVPILADEKADPNKGTGVVMCCTFGDQTDVEWFKKHNLPLIAIMNKDGTLNEKSGKYVGLKVEQARKDIIEDLKTAGLLKGQKKIMHAVNVGERSGVPVEILHTYQWYVKYLDKREEFLQAAKELNWFPEHMRSRLENWIKGLNWDWSVSRQRSFGVPIPVWYDKSGKVYYADEKQLPVDPLKDRPLGVAKDLELIPEMDVFDTWFTSGSSPFLAINLVKDEAMKKQLFPMSLRPQAHDIINFWLFYTLAKTRLIEGKVNPWKDVIISGYVLDSKGFKMSKSKGNTIEPQVMVEKYSADALRFAAASTKLGMDIPFQEKELEAGKRVINKLFNAHKFASMLLDDFKSEERDFEFSQLQGIDQWIILKAQDAIKQVIQSYESYDYAQARTLAVQFFMSDIADNYIEVVKQRLWKKEEVSLEVRKSAQKALYYVLSIATRLLAPVLVYITEEVYQQFYKKYESFESVHVWQFPVPNTYSIENLSKGNILVELVIGARKYKSEKQISMKESIKKSIITCSQEQIEFFKQNWYDVKSVTSIEEVEFIEGKEFSFSFN